MSQLLLNLGEVFQNSEPCHFVVVDGALLDLRTGGISAVRVPRAPRETIRLNAGTRWVTLPTENMEGKDLFILDSWDRVLRPATGLKRHLVEAGVVFNQSDLSDLFPFNDAIRHCYFKELTLQGIFENETVVWGLWGSINGHRYEVTKMDWYTAEEACVELMPRLELING